ncbi:OmpA/MotB family protein [Calycomorphotria hydatis]|uniref:Motility protein B n=1 Tax=Calycomorphotria hydatis TaxID=2528027 RepID=A0A517T3M0_9PLAN|nr:flagellar motor protein MotB [Calycomorphotria hydatis]QDT62973.1 Motility protein B [Calycomorphotria hydatis]
MAMPEDDGPPGVPEWVVTYGDMMSLLLTFFIMLVSLSEVAADKKYRSVMQALQNYMGYPTAQPSPPGKNFPMNSMVERLTQLGSFRDDTNGHGGIKRQSVEGLDVRVYRNRDGDAVPAGPPILFEPNSIDWTSSAVPRLEQEAKLLAGKPNKIELRSYAPKVDNLRESLRHYDLAYARARKVLRYLEAAGVRRNRFRIVTAASHHHSTELNLPPDRVEIVSLNTHTDELVGPREE